MPATFAHFLMAQKAIDRVQRMAKKVDAPKQKAALEYASKIGEKNNSIIAGAAAPDYPYLTDILTTSILPISHTWANRMHYEETLQLVKEGVKSLAGMDKQSESFAIRLAWFCGFVSHVIADSYVHPVVNSIVGGIYLFTHNEHGKCELVQDVYIFNNITGNDIVTANPRDGSFGYLKILEECSDPADEDKNRIHPEIRNFWIELLKKAHPQASEHFKKIIPDRWHYNYKSKINFIADPGAIFRHVIGMTGRDYMKASEIPAEDYKKYISEIALPNGKTSTYDSVFKKTVDLIATIWLQLFYSIESANPENVSTFINNWNLDTGVDENQIVLWPKGGA